MLERIKKKAKSILKSIPPVEAFVQKQIRFKTELALIKGKHKNKNKNPSIIHFSLNKAATQYIKSLMRRCVLENSMVPIRIHEYAFHSDFPFLDHLSSEEMKKYSYIFKKTGYLYSAFGGMIEGIPFLDKYKVILVVRDPRDILVSTYFSIAYSHAVPNGMGDKYDEFIIKRNVAKETKIDDYVISEADRVYQTFSKYQELLLNKYKNIYVTSYEKMSSDFEMWLTQLIKYCDLNVSQELLQSFLQENEDKKPKEENINKHLRKGQPGDYKEKLKPETIEFLNAKFEPILKQFNYEM